MIQETQKRQKLRREKRMKQYKRKRKEEEDRRKEEMFFSFENFSESLSVHIDCSLTGSDDTGHGLTGSGDTRHGSTGSTDTLSGDVDEQAYIRTKLKLRKVNMVN